MEKGQNKKVHCSPVPYQRQIDHGLAQFIFTVGILGKITLIDDIHQMLGLGDTPEFFSDTEAQLPVARYFYPA